jgi:hypothetical protein
MKLCDDAAGVAAIKHPPLPRGHRGDGPDDVPRAGRGPHRRAPPGAALERRPRDVAAGHDAVAARVQAQPRDHRVGVAGVRVDRDPLPRTPMAPRHEARGVERALEQAAAVEGIGDGAGAVVAAALEAGVAAAVDVRLVLQLVGGEDRVLDLDRGAGRGGGGAVRQQLCDGAGDVDVRGLCGREGGAARARRGRWRLRQGRRGKHGGYDERQGKRPQAVHSPIPLSSACGVS